MEVRISRSEVRSKIIDLFIFRWFLFGLGSWLGVYLTSMLYWQPIQSTFPQSIYALTWSVPVGFIGGLIFCVLMSMRRIRPDIETSIHSKDESIAHVLDVMNDSEFIGLYIGQSIGFLDNRGHESGIRNGYDVVLSREDCSKNIIAFGGTGGGKTSRTINPILLQIFRQDASALIFDIKTDFHKEVDALTSEKNRSYKVVGDGGMTLNLFRGCTPELAASYLKSCFLAQGQGFGDSAFWVDSATELCRHALTLLMLLRPDSYSIAGLYDIVFDENDRNNLLIKGADNISRMTDREQRFFTQSQRYFVNIWNEHEDKLKKNILGTVNAVLSPFAHPDLVDAFSAGSTLGEADMSELINERSVFLVNLPMTKYGKEGARFAYLIIKLRFMNMMRERKSQSNWNQVRPVAFICDEYQAIIDSISDTDFWDKSRSTKTIGIVSMQGVSSLIHALNGNEKAANTILQNFRQRIFYRTEDEATIRHIKGILGQVDVEIESTSQSDSQSDSYSQSSSQGQSRSFSSNISTSSSIQRYDLFSSNDMRNLSADFCLFIGNIGDSAADDVLRVDPVYV